MYRILVVDDEAKIRSLIGKYAAFEGHETSEAKDGMEAVSLLRSGGVFDIVIMDIMMPNLDGFSAVREIRKFSDVPIIMPSARGEEYDRINGFQLGIDDYIVKPFSPKELMLRVDAVLMRYRKGSGDGKQADEKEVLRFCEGGLVIDIPARIVYTDGKRVEMTPREYDLIFYMARNRNIALSREKLITEVWGYDYYGDDRTLDTHIKLLRRSLGKYSKYIVTLRGVGYRFEPEK
ncbi:MAG: response regulator transcription factor [Clostridia bacterium]|nr:response regulator transcription factor [Clostridia bacterium]